MRIVILTTLYNAQHYIARCINSVKMQSIQDFLMVITDDISTDTSMDIVKREIEIDSRFRLIENTSKMYQPGNYYQVSKMSEIDDEDILVTLDGDDWFPDNKVLERVLSYYESTSCLMSFGQFIQFHGEGSYSVGFTARPSSDDVRNCDWTCSHLRTFKAKVFRAIKEEDLKAPNGNYWEVTGDQAIVYPMIEMCGLDRVHFTEDINYVYNVENVINDFKVNADLQRNYSNLIKAKPKYARGFNQCEQSKNN